MPGWDAWCTAERVRSRWRRRSKWLPKHYMQLSVKRGGFLLRCWYNPGRGLYPAWSKWTDRRDAHAVVYRYPEMDVKKRTAVASPAPGDGPKHLAPLTSKNFQSLPNLVMHCCVCKYDDGDPRQPGWLSIRSQGAAWVVTLKDPDTGTQMQCLGNTLDDALALADMMAGSDDAPWEIDPWAKKQASKKKT